MADGDNGVTWLDRVRRGEHFEMPDPTLIADLIKTRALVDRFNALPVSEFDQRTELMRQFFGKVGTNVLVMPGLNMDVGVNISIGNDVFINVNSTFLAAFPVTIGNGVAMGPSVMIMASGHPPRAADRKRRDPVTGQTKEVTIGAPIVIGDDVWIGAGVIVLPGVTIGARCTIGAGSVVTKSIPPDMLAYGNPCRPVRSLA
ncbi:MAG: sugar O-acetyltransferase [Bauldia sp.]